MNYEDYCRSKVTYVENGHVQVELNEETLEDMKTIARRVFTICEKPLTDNQLFLLTTSIVDFFFSYDDNIGHLEDLLSYIAEFLGDYVEALERSRQNE